MVTHLTKRSGGVSYASTWWNAKGDDTKSPDSRDLPTTPGETVVPTPEPDRHTPLCSASAVEPIVEQALARGVGARRIARRLGPQPAEIDLGIGELERVADQPFLHDRAAAARHGIAARAPWGRK